MSCNSFCVRRCMEYERTDLKALCDIMRQIDDIFIVCLPFSFKLCFVFLFCCVSSFLLLLILLGCADWRHFPASNQKCAPLTTSQHDGCRVGKRMTLKYSHKGDRDMCLWINKFPSYLDMHFASVLTFCSYTCCLRFPCRFVFRHENMTSADKCHFQTHAITNTDDNLANAKFIAWR